jgi:hypothetical protein
LVYELPKPRRGVSLNMTKIHCLVFCLFVAGPIAFSQQLIVLNNGTQLEGRFDGGNADTIRFIDEHGNRHKFNVSEVQSLTLNPRTSADSNQYDPGPATSPERVYVDEDAAPGAGWSQSAVIPAGTEILVRTIDPIEVSRPDPRQHFLASLERDVRDSNGNVVIPRGSMAHLIVHDVGDGDIAVDLRSVSVNGRRYILNSENIINAGTRQGLGANKRTGKFVGGGALLGTVLGAIGGGGKGAAIGALVGGAAGAGTQVLTRGPALHIPSETILRFRLDHPVYLFE